jgi:hypothetical protein
LLEKTPVRPINQAVRHELQPTYQLLGNMQKPQSLSPQSTDERQCCALWILDRCALGVLASLEKRIMSFRDAEREGPRLTKQGTVAFVSIVQPQTAASLKLWLDEIRVEVRLGVLAPRLDALLVMLGVEE